jgi:cyclase
MTRSVRRTLRVLAMTTLVAMPAVAQPTGDNFELVKVADGVYTAVQRDPLASPIDGNTTVIINERDVVVVDTKITPAAARAVIREIKRLTNNPVRYVVNTHWHSDHHYGNDAYRQAFPGVEFIGHSQMRADFLVQDTDTLLERNLREVYPKMIADRKQMLQTGKRPDGTPLTPAARAFTERQIPQLEWASQELKGVKLLPPNLTVDREMILYRGARTIEIRFLGRANTRGDLVVVLPQERVVITGDILVNPIPFSFGSYLGDWVKTLAAIKALPVDIIVPGHGRPQHDWTYLDRVSRLIASTVEQTRKAVAEGKDLEATRKAVSLEAFKKEFAGDDVIQNRSFDNFFTTPAVERAWKEARGEIDKP